MQTEEHTYLDAPEEYWLLSEDALQELIGEGGCGPGGLGDYLVPDKLYGVINVRPACMIHDYMYAVGKTEADKDLADKIFLENMQRIILWETAGWYDDPHRQEVVRKECFRQAETYHYMVATFGGPSFWANKDKEKRA